MTDTLLASVLLGLTRRPLQKADLTKATRIFGDTPQPMQVITQLAAHDSLLSRAHLKLTGAEDGKPAILVPAHASYFPAFAKQLDNYLKHTQAVLKEPDFLLLYQLGLPVPAAQIMNLLEASFRTHTTDSRAFALLGIRGAWLGAQHPSYKAKVAFLLRDKIPKDKRRHSAFAAFHLAQLRLTYRHTQPLSAFAKTAHDTAIQQIKSFLLHYKISAIEIEWIVGQLEFESDSVNNEFWRKLILNALTLTLVDREPKAATVQSLLGTIHQAATTSPAAPAESATQDLSKFTKQAICALAIQNLTAIDELIELAITSDNKILVDSPLVTLLYSLLPPTRYQKLITLARKNKILPYQIPSKKEASLPNPFHDKLRISPHTIDEADTTSLVESLAHGNHFQPDTSAFHWISKLHICAIDIALELSNGMGASPQLNHLVLALQARQHIISLSTQAF